MLSPTEKLRRILANIQPQSVILSSDFTPAISGSTVVIGSGTVIETYTAFVNGGGEFPATYLSVLDTTPVSFPAGPTSGYIYLEILMQQPDGPDSTQEQASVGFTEVDISGNAYGFNFSGGSSVGRIDGLANLTSPFVFYQTKQTSSSEYFRKILASVELDGSGTPTSVTQIHYGDVYIPQPTNMLFGFGGGIL